MRKPCRVGIVAKRSYGYLVELEFETTTPLQADPGQFVHVGCERWGLILRRPYSLSSVKGSTASIMVREVGEGSAWLCAAEPGQSLDVMGPLGRGFAPGTGGNHVLVAGGTGVAPLIFLASRLQEQGETATFLWGVENGSEYGGLAGELYERFGLRLATMNGDAGFSGNAVDLLQQVDLEAITYLYACGPGNMLSGIAGIAGGIVLDRLQVCTEERMACGIGACRGCVVPAATPGGGYLAVCKDGPVFRGRELDWKRMEP